MADRIILHCDLNNFFASVSLLDNPTLYDVPVAVCGSAEERHGIVLAKNEIAKKYGVKTAEAVWEAKAKCPELVILRPNYEKYRKYSEATRSILSRYTDLLEPFGIDEAWLDVTGSTLLFGDGEAIAESIRATVKKELGLTVSVGVSFNKVFAKLGSDMKKPDAVTVITRENFKQKVWPLAVSELLFVGKSTTKRLGDLGILTIGDVAECDDLTLERLLGKNGRQLKEYALGEDNSPVLPYLCEHIPKSIGRSITPAKDITTPDEVWSIFISQAETIAHELRKYSLYAGSIQVHTRTTALKVKEFSRALSSPTDLSMTIAKKGFELFQENYLWDMPLRSVGLRVSSLRDDTYAVQQDMFFEEADDSKDRIIESSIDSLRERFGKSSIKRGRTL